ncbi:hypothetical protein HY468_03350 [Candidatus Roizmanbacteria bacterium]|nr:hypothetical protein [Candidatus Roizmanbacteria bacterium]
MIQDVLGIKEFQSKLPLIARTINQVGGHYVVTNRTKPSLVAIPFSDYQEIEDILLELNSPDVQNDIKKGREEYKMRKTKKFRPFIESLDE